MRFVPGLAIMLMGLLMGAALFAAPRPTRGPLQVCAENPRYFCDGSGKAVYLAGAHDGWELQDYAWGDKNQGVRFDWDGFLNFLVAHNHNVVRLWCVEHTKITDNDPDLTTPMPYVRVAGRGKANDGEDKFDLERFNDAYFRRLRSRVRDAQRRGIYVIVMLFQGWSIEDKGGRVNPYPYHPFHRNNNVNGMDGDLNGDGQGKELHTWLGEQHPITRRQRAYVRRVIDAVNDLDNVLYEISNESHTESLEWQSRMVDFIRRYEKTKPQQHPVGMTVPFGGRRRQGLNADLLGGPADWISPNAEAPRGYNFRTHPPPADGRKVVLSDSDHLFGDEGRDYTWVWKTFCRGYNLLFMDKWSLERSDPEREKVRKALGYTRRFAARLNLSAVTPREELASSRYCLAHPGREYLVYLPSGGAVTVDLSDGQGPFVVEWFNPRTGIATAGGTVPGGARCSLTAPFEGDAVLHLKAR